MLIHYYKEFFLYILMKKALLKCLVYLNPRSKKHVVTVEHLEGNESGLMDQEHLNEESMEVYILEEREEKALVLLPKDLNGKELIWVDQEKLL
jgi:hypothetical protein